MLLKRIDKLESLNQQLLSENETLRRLLDERPTDEQDRVKLVTEIAKMERRNVYNDITSLMKNQDRFGLDNLLEYSPSKWLSEPNLVVVKFIQALTHNEYEDRCEGEKLFKCAVAVDAVLVYGARLAARRTFASIWSARQHPIYRLIELADEEQRLRLKPEIDKLIQERIMTSCSKLSDQHQGHDAILEEINKMLKLLVPSIPSQRHWEIAARNYTKLLKLRTNLFNVIGYTENETHKPRTRPSFIAESQRFRVE